MSLFDRYSSLDDISDCYYQTLGYEQADDLNMCGQFIQACIALLRRFPMISEKGTERVQFDIKAIREELHNARVWWRNKNRKTASVMMDFQDFRC